MKGGDVWGEQGVKTNGYGVSFGGDVKVRKLIVAMVAQL